MMEAVAAALAYAEAKNDLIPDPLGPAARWAAGRHWPG